MEAPTAIDCHHPAQREDCKFTVMTKRKKKSKIPRRLKRYHLAWNVVHRRSSFPDPQNTFKMVNDAFFGSSSLVGSFVSLLWLVPDHVHVYLESDGEKPVENIAQEIKRLSESSILRRSSEMVLNAVAGDDLWDKAYFAETLG